MAKRRDFVIFGLGKFGSSVALTLVEKGCSVLAIEQNEEIVQDISDLVTHAVTADATDQEVLNALGIRNFDAAVVAINDMQASILCTVMAKEMGVPFIVAKAQSDIHKRVLEKVGADKIIFPEREIGKRVAYSLTTDNFLDYIDMGDDYSIVEVEMKEDWLGKNLITLNFRKTYGVNVIALKKGDTTTINISPEHPFSSDEILIVIGKKEDINKISS